MSKKSLIAYRSKGLTLIEVIASVALLGTLMVGMLVVHAKHSQQIRLAAKKQIAASLADSLIASWFLSDERFPKNSTGRFESDDQFWWTTQTRGSVNSNSRWAGEVVQLQVWHDASKSALLQIELLEESVSSSAGISNEP